MKQLKVLAFAVLAIAVVGTVFAFAMPHKAKFANRYFVFSSSAPYTLTALQTPSNWTEETTGTLPSSDGTPGFVHEIVVTANQSTYINSSNQPKVNASPLSADVQTAFNSGGTPTEVDQTDYSILVNSVR